MTDEYALAAPDLEVPCCMTAAVTGGERCSCWRPVLDMQPSEALQEGPLLARRKACDDCAYRAGSPEREADGGALPDFGRHAPFMCHQGAPKVIRWEHPSGAVIVPEGDDYQPTTRHGAIWLADGRPGEYCAGWAAVNRIREVTA